MVARCASMVLHGVQAQAVMVEAAISSTIPGMTIVGLADAAVNESRDRVRSAIRHSELPFPRRHITIALLPASVRKRGSGLDAAIAATILCEEGALRGSDLDGCVIIGELGLDGSLHPVTGILVCALEARRLGCRRLVVPAGNAREALLVPDIEVWGTDSLGHLVGLLRGEEPPRVPSPAPATADSPKVADLSDVRGQFVARVGLEVAAAGGHHVVMTGPPGVGKTLLAERLPGILPDLDDEAAVEVTSIRSVAGLLEPGTGLVRRPPFQAPHHTATPTAIIGGGQGGHVRIGSVSLAHRGVLFLDEAPELPRAVLESLRQPLESGEVRIARADFTARLPAKFQLVIAANPCPCGQAVGTGAECSCSPMARRRYSGRLSGPVLDRMDLRLVLGRPGAAELESVGESSADVAQRVGAARERALARWSRAGRPWRVNADVPGPSLRRDWAPDAAGQELLRRGQASGAVTLRGADRVLRVAWTLADLNGVDRPGHDQVAYALSLRGEESAWAR